MSVLANYAYRGARALVLLHEHNLRSFIACWREAYAAGLQLPETEDPDYQSLEHLLAHVFRAARGYMVWMCKQLDLPDPQIEAAPLPENILERLEDWPAHLLERWRLPLADVDEERCYTPDYVSNWGSHFCIDAMLEHAVVHPQRHEFQLRELMDDMPTPSSPVAVPKQRVHGIGKGGKA